MFKKLDQVFRNEAVKGDSGCILIIGGSKDYVGAPYFSSLAALRTGSDLVYIFCQKEALIPLKTLLPEAIVTEIGFREFMLKRVTACVIGPGLGIIEEESEVFKLITQIVDFLAKERIPIILDGDGLRLYSNHVFKNYPVLLLTPNVKERKKALWLEPNHILIEKGKYDIIRIEERKEIVKEQGIIRRCGGQGDILVGILSSFISWADCNNKDELIYACKDACILVRKAGVLAMNEKGYSVIASDILNKLPQALNEE